MTLAFIAELLETFSTFTDSDQPGINRLALTQADQRARDYLKRYMLSLGLTVHIDSIGNMIGIRAGSANLPAVAIGSHLDSVKNGGRYDGTIGIIAGLAVMKHLHDHQIMTSSPIALINFTNEEGVRFTPDMMGSYVFSGKGDLEEMYAAISVDSPHQTVRQSLEEIGYKGETAIGSIPLHSFIELHIEQGKILEEKNATIGIVERVQGIYWTEYVYEGEANHAGTTPMHYRRDAGLAAMKLATYAHELANTYGAPHVMTVGSLQLEPNVANIVPGYAKIIIDNRFPETTQLKASQEELDRFAHELAETAGLSLKITPLVRFLPVAFDERIVALLEDKTLALNLSYQKMISGAGHDAQMVALTYPAAMVFVPSKDGISHNPQEFTALEHIEMGIRVIKDTVLQLAEEAS